MERELSKQPTKKQEQDTLPHNKDAEKALLGSLLINNDEFFDVSGLAPDSFYYKANGQVFEAITSLILRNSIADPITVSDELDKLGYKDIGEEKRGKDSYLIHLIGLPTSSMYATDYARIVRENAVRRKIILAANNMATSAWNDSDFQDVVNGAQEQFLTAIRNDTPRQVRHIGDGANDYAGQLQKRIQDPTSIPGIQTGFLDLDRVLNGLKPQELIVIAARPGMGKTAMMLALADFMSVRQYEPLTGIIFSLEMSEQELINRLVSRRTKIDGQKLDKGDLTIDEQALAYKELAVIQKAPIYITDLPGLSVSQMYAEATRIKMLHGLDYIMVDFLQLADSGSKLLLYEKVSQIARGLKNLAKGLEVPVVALSQLNRSVENRPDKRPRLADLRDSGQIEEALDTGISLFRAEYYDPEIQPHILECGIMKQRNGPFNVNVDLYFDGPTMTVHNLEQTTPNPFD